MHRNLKGIIRVDFNAKGQLLLVYSTLVMFRHLYVVKTHGRTICSGLTELTGIGFLVYCKP